MRWTESLHFRFSVLQAFLLFVIVGTTIAVMVTVERQLLLEQGYELAEQLGGRVVSELEERTTLAQSLATSLASLGESLKHDASEYMSIVPHLINYEGEESFIAGGGIWPEPNAFESGVERRSFFWGRDSNGVLQYYDDYNDPKGNGYHHEEWYVPATYSSPGGVFWSKSYMDPYSYQPMVTCTVPMRENGKITGVSTVDVKLDGLGAFFEKTSQRLGGYIFAVDRNNKFLSFPKPEWVKSYSKDEKGKTVEEYLSIQDFATKNPAYQVIADALNEINIKTIRAAKSSLAFNEQVAKEIDERSYQINQEEAELTAAIVNGVEKLSFGEDVSTGVKRIFISVDPLLKKRVMVSVFLMPVTHWKVVVVMPTSKFFAVADSATRKVASYVIALELLVFLLLFIALRSIFIKPIRLMSMRVKRVSEVREALGEKLDDSARHELGELAYQFNKRTEQLTIALERIDQSKDILEKLVTIRTSELERSKTRFQNILEAASDGIVSINEEQKIILFNQQAQTIFGYQTEEILGKPLEILLPERFRGGHPDLIKEYITSGATSKTMSMRPELLGLRKNGQEFPVVITISKVKVEEKIICTAIVRDVSEKKRFEETIQQSEKMSAIGRLAGGVAHDFNNLLTVILGHAMLLKTLPLDPDVILSIDEIQSSATRAAALTKQLLAYSRKQILQLKIVDLNEIIRGVDKMIRRLIGENIELVILLDEHLPRVKLDSSQMEQVLMNLAVNARDSMPNGGKIVMETSVHRVSAEATLHRPLLHAGDYVQLVIRDTGSGMSEEVKNHIFEPFFTTKEKGKGTGLGLATVDGIIKQMEGYIYVDSEVGKGSTFAIYLPPSEVQDAGLIAPPPKALPTGHETLLLVEDEELVRGLALKVLKKQGFRVIEAHNGQEAVDVYQKHLGEPISLLITDMVMPYMGGSELAEKFSQTHPGVRIIFASGYSDHSVVQKWLDKGHLFLQKPYTPTELLQVVRAALDAPKAGSGG